MEVQCGDCYGKSGASGRLAGKGGLLVVGRRALEICGVKVGEPTSIAWYLRYSSTSVSTDAESQGTCRGAFNGLSGGQPPAMDTYLGLGRLRVLRTTARRSLNAPYVTDTGSRPHGPGH